MPSIIVKNMNDIRFIIETKVKKALELTHEEITDTLQYHIDRYYDEVEPVVYRRTEFLKKSPIKTDIVKVGNSYSCKFGISDDYLEFEYPDLYKEPFTVPDVAASGYEVLSWNNLDGSHGNTVRGKVRIWHDTMEDLNGVEGILSIFKRNLKVCGVNVK